MCNFSVLVAPLFDLTRKRKVFVWDEPWQESSEHSKRVLTSTLGYAYRPMRSHRRWIPMHVIKASEHSCLIMQTGRNGVVAFGSYLLTANGRIYCVTRKELLAIVHFTFVLRTDHAALQWLQRTRGRSANYGDGLSAWLFLYISINEMMMMAEFDFQVIHRPWREHGNVDAFSGRPCRQRGLEDRNVVAAVTEGLLKRNPAPHRHKVCIALRVKTLIQLLWGLGYRPMRSHTRWIPMHVIKILEHSCLKHREH